jgi:hypothetical protein
MLAAIERTTAFALYQLSLLLALLLLPVAVLARHGGLTLPLGRLVERTGRVYAAARDGR